MNNIEIKKKPTNYQRWAFRLFIYLVVLNITIFYLYANYIDNYIIGNDNPIRFNISMTIIIVVEVIVFISGIISSVLSIIKKEKKNYWFYIAVIGYIFFITRLLVFPFLN